ncbi:MAG: hypothetical protein ACE14W_13330, partial [Candidatus Velamenicoccus archaeovorus]
YEVLDLGPGEPGSRYRLLIDGRWVLGSDHPSDVIDDLFANVNADTMAVTTDLVPIHAGAVVAPDGRGVLIPAPSGSGKSTLVAALVRAGFGYLSDEAAILDPSDGRVLPYPKHLTLKEGTGDPVGRAAPRSDERSLVPASKWHADPESLRPGSVAGAAPIGTVIAYRYEPGAPTSRQDISAAEAVVELGRNLMLARRDLPRSLDVLARLCRSARAFCLVSGNLEEGVALVVELTRPQPPPTSSA